jgi:FemAB-related protein (PEP-CTERM system-associated)
MTLPGAEGAHEHRAETPETVMTATDGQRGMLTPVETPDSPILIKDFESSVAERWDRFVLEHPRASFFHLIGWKRVLERTFGYRGRYFYSESNGKITGIAPFFDFSNWLVGSCLVSVPLAAYGGIIAEDEHSEQALLEHAKHAARSGRFDYIELRNRGGGILNGFHPNTLYVTFHIPLSPDPAVNLKRLPKDTRYMIRKASKGDLSVRYGADPERMDVFYDLFAQSVRRLGTPVFPKALFRNILEEFPKQTQLMLVCNGSQAVSGVLSFFFRDTILPYYAGAREEATHLSANNYMYWELIRWAGEQGFHTFDFGRSKKGTGSFAFKSQWGMNVEPLDYQVLLVNRKTVPNYSPVNPKFGMFIRVWKNLPLSVTKWLGPSVVRLFP